MRFHPDPDVDSKRPYFRICGKMSHIISLETGSHKNTEKRAAAFEKVQMKLLI